MAGVNSYKDGVVSRLFKGLTGLIKGRGITVIEGAGRLTGPREVTVDGTAYTGRHVVLASGSYARSLPGLDVDGERVITSEHALRLDRVPASVIVLGGGVIGCEFASVWRSFGADVTIIEALPRLVAVEDEASSKALERAFRKRGIDFRTGTPFQSVKTTDDGVAVTVEGGDVIEAELLLVAVGRGPTTDGLGYDEQGVAMDRGFVLADERCRTNLDGVYAVGDIVPGLQLAHRGFQQGIFVAEEIAGLGPPPIDEAGIPRVTYSHPEVASVGLTEAQAAEKYGADGRDADLRPRRQRQEPDPQDPGLREAGPPQGRPRRRRPPGRRPGRRADRRGAADLQLGGVRRGRRAPRPRPPDPERSPRRGPPGPGRQAPARPLLTPPPTEPSPRRSSMATEVNLPALGESVTEGTVTRWLKQVGDTVAVDEPLLEVSTDKVDTEIPSPVAGTLLEIKANEDDTVEVGAVLAVIGDEGESAAVATPRGEEPSASPPTSRRQSPSRRAAEAEARSPRPSSRTSPSSERRARRSRPRSRAVVRRRVVAAVAPPPR